MREERQAEAEAAPKRPAKAKPAGNGQATRSGPSKNAVRRVAELEREVERAEASLAAVEDELADPAMWSSPTRRDRATKRHADAKQAVEAAYAAWEERARGARAPGPALRSARAGAGRAKRGAAAGAGQPRPGTDGASVQQGGFPARDAVRETLVATPGAMSS